MLLLAFGAVPGAISKDTGPGMGRGSESLASMKISVFGQEYPDGA